MKTVNYNQVLQKLSEMMGMTYSSLPSELALRYRGFIDGRLCSAWESEWWPDLKRTERRHLRRTYRAATAYVLGDEVWWPQENSYYQALKSGSGTAPTDADGNVTTSMWCAVTTNPSGDAYSATTAYTAGVQVWYEATQSYYQCISAVTGTAPDAASGPTYWGEIRPFNRRLAEQQTEDALSVSSITSTSALFTVTTAVNHGLAVGDQVVISGASPATYLGRWTVGAATGPKTFTATSTLNPGSASGSITCTPYLRPLGDVYSLYDTDPRNTTRWTEIGFRNLTDGIQVNDLPGTFWLEHRLRRPILVGSDYDSAATYAVDDQILFTTGSTENFYTCLVATSAGQSPTTHPGKWDLCSLPYIFFNYLVWGSYADALRMDGQQDKAAVADRQAEAWLNQETNKLYGQQAQYDRLRVSTY